MKIWDKKIEITIWGLGCRLCKEKENGDHFYVLYRDYYQDPFLHS